MSFPNYTKAEWLAKVEKDLRGKPLDNLNFTVAGEELSPFWHREDQPIQQSAVVTPRSEPCKTGIALEVNNLKEANKTILDLLNKGANALLISSASIDVVAERETILQEVLLEYVDVYFKVSTTAPGYFSPQFTVFSTAAGGPVASTDFVQRFADLLRQASDTLATDPEDFRPVFWVKADDDYLSTIARLRALRLCYQLIAHKYGSTAACRITVAPVSTLTDKYSGMISSSAICTAAVIGGADTVFVPSGTTDDPREQTFLRRVAINGMNIIDHEAYLNRVADPAAGSYFIEALTDTYARQIWAAFQQLVAK